MCRILFSQVAKRSSRCSTLLSDNESESLRLRKLFKELRLRCEEPQQGLDLLEFSKFCALPGLLGEQFFRALDSNDDGKLARSEFVCGLLRLYKGSNAEIAELLFVLFDFGQKGFITPSDVRSLLLYLPQQCLRCGERLSKCSVESRVESCFSGDAVLRFEDVLQRLDAQQELLTELVQTLITSLPLAVDEAVDGACNRCTQREGLKMPLKPLRLAGRRYLCELRNATMYCFHSVGQLIPKKIISVEGLFVAPQGELGFRLSSLRVAYEFVAESTEERDEWVELLLSVTHFRWFDDYYETKEVLGCGAHGQVLRAVSRLSGAAAAVKIISKTGMDTAAELRMRRELTVLRHASHPSLVKLLDCFETDERVYIVTELLAGSLYAYLEERRFGVPEEFSRKVASEVASGLAFLHENRIVHRDVKLENIMLRREGESLRAVLVDFGLSCFLGPGEETIEGVGTLKYAAPEVISRLRYSESVDCWSFGIVLFILLRGKMPFYGKTDQEIAQRVLKRRLDFSCDKWTSPQAAAVVAGLLCRKAEQRLGMDEFLVCDWLHGVTAPLGQAENSILG